MSVREFVSTGPFSLIRRVAEELDRLSGDFALQRGGAKFSSQIPLPEGVDAKEMRVAFEKGAIEVSVTT